MLDSFVPSFLTEVWFFSEICGSPVMQLTECEDVTWPSLHCPVGTGAQETGTSHVTLATAIV